MISIEKTDGKNTCETNSAWTVWTNLLSSRQQVLLLVFFNAGTARLHLQRWSWGLLGSWLDEMSKQFSLLQEVLESVGPVCFLLKQNSRRQQQHTAPCLLTDQHSCITVTCIYTQSNFDSFLTLPLFLHIHPADPFLLPRAVTTTALHYPSQYPMLHRDRFLKYHP